MAEEWELTKNKFCINCPGRANGFDMAKRIFAAKDNGMDSKKVFHSRVEDGVLHVRCTRENVRLIHHEESLQWAKELLGIHERYDCLHLAIDLSGMDYVSYVAIDALLRIKVELGPSGSLLVRGVRPHVLGVFLAIAPSLGARSDHAAPAADSIHAPLAA